MRRKVRRQTIWDKRTVANMRMTSEKVEVSSTTMGVKAMRQVATTPCRPRLRSQTGLAIHAEKRRMRLESRREGTCGMVDGTCWMADRLRSLRSSGQICLLSRSWAVAATTFTQRTIEQGQQDSRRMRKRKEGGAHEGREQDNAQKIPIRMTIGYLQFWKQLQIQKDRKAHPKLYRHRNIHKTHPQITDTAMKLGNLPKTTEIEDHSNALNFCIYLYFVSIRRIGFCFCHQHIAPRGKNLCLYSFGASLSSASGSSRSRWPRIPFKEGLLLHWVWTSAPWVSVQNIFSLCDTRQCRESWHWNKVPPRAK